MPRLTLTEISQEIETFREMGVFFTILSTGRVSFDVTGRAIACVNMAAEFRDQHEDALRLCIESNGDQQSLRRLDFYRWLAESGHWGKFPGLRVLPLTRRSHVKRKAAAAH